MVQNSPATDDTCSNFATSSHKFDRQNCFIEKVLRRILFHVNPPEHVICLCAHWQLSQTARQQLHYRLAVPKHGVFLLPYPTDASLVNYRLPFDRFLWNETLDETEVKKRIRRFMSGIESLVLNEINANLNLYKNLTTFMITFDVRHLNHEAISYKPKNKGNQGFSEENSDSVGSVLCFAWHFYAKTIRAVTAACASTLQHFVFIDSTDEKASLSRQFYSALRLDKMLCKMSSLQTLYLPSIPQYESASVNTRRSSRTRAWKALHGLPAVDRLPGLRRVVIDSKNELIVANDMGAFNNMQLTTSGLRPRSTTGLPNFPATANNNLLIEVTDDLIRQDQFYENQLVFPNATVTSRYARESYVAEAYLNSYDIVPFNGLDNFFSWIDDSPGRSPYVDTVGSSETIFVGKLTEFVDRMFARRCRQLSVWQAQQQQRRNHLHLLSQTEAESAVGEIGTLPHIRIFFFIRTDGAQSPLRTLHKLHELRCFSGPNRISSFVIDLCSFNACDSLTPRSEKSTNHFSTLRHFLPLYFSTSNNDAVSVKRFQRMQLKERLDQEQTNLKYFAQEISTWLAPLTASFNEANKTQNGGEALINLYEQYYKLPKIELSFQFRLCVRFDADLAVDSISVWDTSRKLADCHGSSKIETWINVIERIITDKMRHLVSDAIESSARRDLKYSVYQSIRKCSYWFHIRLPSDKQFSARSLPLQLPVLIQKVLQARAPDFARRMLTEVFDKVVVYEHGELARANATGEEFGYEAEQLACSSLMHCLRQVYVKYYLHRLREE